MALKLVLAPQARKDIEEIVDYIATRDVSASRRMLLQIDTAIERLTELPFTGPTVAPRIALRKMSVPPYIVFYAAIGVELQVIRVIHSARDTEIASVMRRRR